MTITELDVTRFMMTRHDVINLVFFAFENAKRGDLFVQKPLAATILDLAKTLAVYWIIILTIPHRMDIDERITTRT